MEYQVPVKDMRFVLNELLQLEQLLELPGFEDITPDVVNAVLEENARFVDSAIAPLNRQGDTQPAVWEDGKVTTTPGFKEAFKEYASGGWQGLHHSPDIGGQGLPKAVAASVTESINGANLSFSLCPLLTDGVIEALTLEGSEAQQALYIPPMLEGRWTGTMNLTEPQAGSDLAQVATRAVPQDDGSYRLSGQKIFITFGEHDLAENIVHLVLARTPDAPKGVKGISLFIVPKYVPNEDGSIGPRNDVWCASLEDKLGIHGSPTAVLLYGSGKGEVGEGAIGYLVGQENEGLKFMFIMMNAARYSVGLQGIAVSEAALQAATAYAAERVQGTLPGGDGTPVTIDHHPDVQRMLLTMRALTEGGRALAYMAAAANDVSLKHGDAETRQQNRAIYEYLVPIVKGFGTENAVKVASLGIQVHGGMGYIEETGAAQFYRDARILPIYEGTTAIQANDLLGRKLWRDGGAVASGLATEMAATVKALKAAAQEAPSSTSQAASVAMMATQFEKAVKAFEQANAYLLAQAKGNVAAAFLGSVPYLMLAGNVLAGWQMAKATLLAANHLAQGSKDEFYKTKFATGIAYATFVLPQATSFAESIQQGEALVALA